MEASNQTLSKNALMVKTGEVVFPDVLVHLPIFSPARTDEIVRYEIKKLHISNNCDFTDIVIVGKKLNVKFHKKAYAYCLSKAQQQNSTTVTIDLPEMFSRFGFDAKDFSHYSKTFNELMDALYKMEISYTSPSGVKFHGRLINFHTEPKDGISTVDFGGIFQQLLNSHPNFSRLNYLEDRIKGDVATVLKEKLDIEYRKLSGTNKKTISVKAEYLIQSLMLSGDRESQVRAVNNAFKYFMDKKYIISVEKKTRLKKIYEFKITFNPHFKMEDFDDVIKKGKIAKAIATKPIVADAPASVILNISDGVDLVGREDRSDDDYLLEFDSLFTNDFTSSTPEQAVDVQKSPNDTIAICEFNDWVNATNE
ncbi:hypothetical protein [Pseudomonas syringae group genomosp. 3]|uniref:Initiator Rep protein domain-containing protein n=1 Tax=Pseudomonas syringae pv. coriandricola TaxID=264453 RepID=A0A3M3JE99_9PSED|nr:hypothetical protein [Pseudomonas syringae group genomosp. 3]RMN09036.1 hypothetical protein ALQ65_01656 [Pseudomonas syringae pv. coriandricola]